MISATPALSSAPRSVVPSVVISSWPTWFSSSGDSSGWIDWPESPSTISPPSYRTRCGETPAPLTSRAVSTWANSAIVGTSCSTVAGRVPVT